MTEPEKQEQGGNVLNGSILSILRRMAGDVANLSIEIAAIEIFPDELDFRLMKLQVYLDKITRQIDELRRLNA